METFDANAVLTLFQAAEADLQKKPPAESRPQSGLAEAFWSEYIGTAHVELYEYLESCWAKYKADKAVYQYPYGEIVQSLGFGKTRLLRELAEHFESDATAVKSLGRHRVVYVNVRDVLGSAGFPPKTVLLKSHFFPLNRKDDDDTCVKELVESFNVDMQREVPRPSTDTKDNMPPTVHETPVGLFDGKDGDFTKQLLRDPVKKLSPSDKRQLLVFAVDEARALLPKRREAGIGWFRILRRELKQANDDIQRLGYGVESGIFDHVVDTNWKSSNFVPPAIMDPTQRLANSVLMIFPAFVLTHTMDVLHKTKHNDEGERVADEDTTQTALVRYKKDVADAMQALHQSSARRSSHSWKSLRLRGRPLWLQLGKDATDYSLLGPADKDALVLLAARKLLCESSPHKPESFNDETLNGVAALLCRVGIRPHSSSPMAARVVADFTAVLSYVSHTHEQFVSSYSSDPILTLGATRVWHSFGGCMLAQRMLPELRKLLHQEVLDTGDVGELVARIVLLLAMDVCSVIDGDTASSHWSGAGEFYSVWTFLGALQGDSPTLRVEDPAEVAEKVAAASVSSAQATNTITSSIMKDAEQTATQAALKGVQSQWQDWFVSFTHFVQLADVPSEPCLWAMLGRRAAGIMPRGQKAVDLVIPICTRGPRDVAFAAENVCVSMIFVQVKKTERSNSKFPESATVNMRPCEFFMKKKKEEEKEKEEHKEEKKAKLAALTPDSVLRIYMSVRSEKEERFYVEVTVDGQTSHVLCLKGLAPLSLSVHRRKREGEDASLRTNAVPVSVLTPGVVEALKKLLLPWSKVRTLVEEDIDAGDKKSATQRFGMAKTTLVQCALKPLAETTLLNVEDAECIPLIESRLGRKDVVHLKISGQGKKRLRGAQQEDDKETKHESDASAAELKKKLKTEKDELALGYRGIGD